MQLYIVLSIFLASLSGSCFALECFKCNSVKGCADPFDPASATIETCWSYMMECVGVQDLAGRTLRGCGFLWGYPWANTYYRTVLTKEGEQSEGAMHCKGDLCNAQTFKNAADGLLNCYECTYDEGIPSSGSCSSTDFDPKAIGMSTRACDGTCVIESRTRYGRFTLERNCIPKSVRECVPGCNKYGHCVECCNTNLCNTPSK